MKMDEHGWKWMKMGCLISALQQFWKYPPSRLRDLARLAYNEPIHLSVYLLSVSPRDLVYIFVPSNEQWLA